jgi:SAM-dependent methyltransferase
MSTAPRRCHLCHSEQSRYFCIGPVRKFEKALGRKVGVDYYYCDHCTVLFQHPIFDDAEYKNFYEDVQRSDEAGYKSGEVPKDHLEKKVRDTQFKWKQMALLDVPGMLPGKRVYEIGAAEGTLLASFRDRGYTVAGIEPLASYATYARDVFHLDVTTGYFDDSVADRERADLVILDNVLEHLVDPHDTLCRVRRMLNENGILYIGVPGAEVATPSNASICHITLWTRRALAFVLECAGFQPLSMIHGRPTNRPDEWICLAQACLQPCEIRTATPRDYQVPNFDELSAQWLDMVDRYLKSDERYDKYGPVYQAMLRTARRAKSLVGKLV